MPKGLNYYERLAQENDLKMLSKEDLKKKIKDDFKEDVAAHVPKKSLIKYILEKLFGKE